ncbi:MAG: aminotransferase class I/II-fold pyridoxal phosphate-dependent enzyme [Caldilineaceae bacterium]|nr:aminotransferase class I/II-fold pyridoxal phosphate-dependent enzyme [Caldilineaceae bacterium]MCB0124983.1 aminotransferase class I/II-fold pyridoxal phosphate-dependent enzyme [Caldilineaceae bacterium]
MTTRNDPPSLPSTTQTVHAGERRFRSHNSLTVPIVQTSVYTFDTTTDLVNYFDERMFWDEVEREEYGRYGNPTVRAVEAKLAALEGADDAVLLSSGMAAVTNTLLLLLSQGDHLILTDDCYHQSREFCQNFLPRFGIDCTVVPCGDCDALEAAIRPTTRLLYTESPTNPFMRCVDYETVVAIAKRHNLLTVVDSTFATPVNCRPLDYGIDVVIHSLTKYLGGHNDLMAGAVLGSYQQTTRLRQAQGMLGSIADPHGAYLMLRGIKTLGLRMAQHNANGLAIARFLEDHPKVRRVWYPGLESHPDHALAKATMQGFGGVVSFEIDGDGALAHRFIDALKIPHIGPSLGGVETMVSPLAIMGYAELPEEERLALGIRDELVRFCCGVEATEDLLADLGQALATI